MTKETVASIFARGNADTHDDSVAYRAALPRFTMTNGKHTFETDRPDLAIWQSKALGGSLIDRYDLRASVIRYEDAA